MGGKSYPGAPTLGYFPTAGLEDLAAIHATWRTLEAFGYSVRPVLDYDYIALYIGGGENWMDLRLTWTGYEYLENVRDESKWEMVKRLIPSKGESASVETVKAAVALLLKQAFSN